MSRVGTPVPLLFIALVVAAPRVTAAGPLWARTYGGPGAGELVHAAREMPGGDIVVLASTDSFGTTTGDGWLIRLDASGSVLSQAVAGSPLPGGVDGAVITAEGGAVFASRNVRDIFVRHDAVVTRLAADGSVLWATEVASDPGRYFVNDLVELGDGTFVGVGQAALSDAGPHVGWMLSLDAAGTVLWQRYFGGVVNEDLSLESVIETAGGGLAATGWVTGGAGGTDVLVLATASNGAITWAQRVGGSSDERGSAITELRGGGGYAVAASTDTFTASGHAGWVLRLDASGALTWTLALGSLEWSDLQAITQTSDQALVVLGRISSATNDLWAAKIDHGTASISWQRRYAGASGDHGSEILELADGDLLLAGTSGWGFPEEALWLLRTTPDGTMGSCGLVEATALTSSAPRATRTAPLFPPYPPLGTPGVATVVTDVSSLAVETQCDEAGSCLALDCGVLSVTPPPPACEGTTQVLALEVRDGVPPVTVTWDFNGDTVADETGNPVSVALPVGTTTVTVTATDSCVPVPDTCSRLVDLEILSGAPPGEVSDVRGGALPLLVLDGGARVSFEERGDATEYSLYADSIGSWYAPQPASGTECFLATTPGAAGRRDCAPALPVNTWLVVTASSRCAEGHAGTDSFGTDRTTVGAWSRCGP